MNRLINESGLIKSIVSGKFHFLKGFFSKEYDRSSLYMLWIKRIKLGFRQYTGVFRMRYTRYECVLRLTDSFDEFLFRIKHVQTFETRFYILAVFESSQNWHFNEIFRAMILNNPVKWHDDELWTATLHKTTRG